MFLPYYPEYDSVLVSLFRNRNPDYRTWKSFKDDYSDDEKVRVVALRGAMDYKLLGSKFGDEGGAPAEITLDSAALVITADGSNNPVYTFTFTLSDAPGDDASFTPTGFTIQACNRIFTPGTDSGSISGTTLTIVCSEDDAAYIVGGGTLTLGTPQSYSTGDNKASYAGGDSNLPGVGTVSNLAVSVSGLPVPVVSSLDWNSGDTLWEWRIEFSSAASFGAANFDGTNPYFRATGLKSSKAFDEISNESATVKLATFGNTSGDGWVADAGSDLAVYLGDDTGLTIPAFSFPLYLPDGPLAVPTGTWTISGDFGSNAGQVDGEFSIPLADNEFEGTSEFGGETGSYHMSFVANPAIIGLSSTTFTAQFISTNGANVAAAEIEYAGGQAEMVDATAGARPVPPFTKALS